MNDPIIELNGLSKCYKRKKAVDNLSLRIAKGEVFGLLGPNGAGKTTTLLMMMGLSEPDSGQARVCGYNPMIHPLEVKKRVGYMPDNMGFYTDMTALENLVLIGELNGLSTAVATQKAYHLLETVGLQGHALDKVETFSRGMKQRLGLADVLIKDPEVIVLDEPTLGIDPSGVRDFLRLIKTLSLQHKLTVLLSSHHLHHVQEVCDRVGLFVQGKLVACGAVAELAEQIFPKKGHCTRLAVGGGSPALASLASYLPTLPFVESVVEASGWLEVGTANDETANLVRRVVEKGFDLIGVQQKSYGLDDVYMAYFNTNENKELKYDESKGKFNRWFIKK